MVSIPLSCYSTIAVEHAYPMDCISYEKLRGNGNLRKGPFPVLTAVCLLVKLVKIVMKPKELETRSAMRKQRLVLFLGATVLGGGCLNVEGPIEEIEFSSHSEEEGTGSDLDTQEPTDSHGPTDSDTWFLDTEETQTASETVTTTESGTTDSDTTSQSETGSVSDTGPDSDTESQSDTNSGTGLDSDTGTGSDSQSDTLEGKSRLDGTAPGATKYDSWNNPDNWDIGLVPTGEMSAAVQQDVPASVDNTDTPSYSGGLTLRRNAKLTIGWTDTFTANANALGTGPITMREGSEIIARAGLGHYDFAQGIVLEGDAVIWAGISTANHHTTKTFSGGIQGPGKLTYNGVNNTRFRFTTANPLWTGGFQTGDPQNQRHAVEAAAMECLGTGDVSINNNCTLVIASGLGNAIDDGATLTLSGLKSSDYAGKLVLNSNETVKALIVESQSMAAGQYTSANAASWLSGNGILTVLTGP